MSALVYPPHHVGHRQRLRERFEFASADGLHTYEVLELLLTFSVTRRDVKPVAKELIERFGGLAGVLDASRDELMSVANVGPASATLIRLVREMGTLYFKDRIKKRDLVSDPERVGQYAAMRIGGLPHEAFLVLLLNTQNELLETAVVNEGTVDQVAVYPRRILELALARHAGALILSHNHPSGHLQPSDEDLRLTTALRDAARALDIRVVDHVIVGQGRFYSFAEHQLL